MKYTKKAFAALLAVLALASCEKELTAEEKAARFTYPDKEAQTAEAYEAGDVIAEGDFTFTVSEDLTATVTVYGGEGSAVIIPEKVNGLKVTAIGDSVFAENPVITTVDIPKSVIEIGDRAFYNCVNLLRIIGTENLRYIGEHAFTGTAAASYSDKEFVVVCGDILVAYKGEGGKVTVPEGIRVVSSAFSGKEGITEIKLPRSLKYIGGSAFEGCKDLEFLDVPGGVDAIGSRAFADCISLTEVYIPYDVTELGECIFDGCSAELAVICMMGSAAEIYCTENGIKIKE